MPQPKQLEKEGRLKRYEILSDICKQYHTSNVIVAHHGDDQIETFLMRYIFNRFFIRLYRGSGYSGLACMRSVQEMDDGTRRIRPFLTLSKQRLLATCKTRGISFVLDPSNNDLQYDRNRARLGVSRIKEDNKLDVESILNVVDYFQIVHFDCLFEFRSEMQKKRFYRMC